MIPREFTIPIPTTCTTFTDIPKVWCDGKNLNYAKKFTSKSTGNYRLCMTIHVYNIHPFNILDSVYKNATLKCAERS